MILSPVWWIQEALRREKVLSLFALCLWVAMLPTLIVMGLDDRTLRGVNVWAKPLKFMASVGLFSIYTAWFIGMLPPSVKRAGVIRAIVTSIVIAGTFEVGYITVQAAQAQASHFNFDDHLHGILYALMGLGALAMTTTQAILAVQIFRHGRTDIKPLLRMAVVMGLTLTFVLGSIAGGFLSAMQPPDGQGLPILGWHLWAKDLRPAHFIGMHAVQFLPLAALMLLRLPYTIGRAGLYGFSALLIALWLLSFKTGLGL